MKRLIGISLAAAVLAMVGVNVAQATIIIQPVGVSAVGFSGHSWDGAAGNLIDGSGLSGALPGSPPIAGITHNWANIEHEQVIGGNGVSFVLTFDLGGLYNLSAADIWNFGGSYTGYGPQDYYASGVDVRSGATTGSYGSKTTLTLGVPVQSNPTGADYLYNANSPLQNFAYAATGVQFVEFAVLHPGRTFGGLGEVRFEGEAGETPVPEPGTWLLLGGSLLGLCVGGFKRIRSKLSA